MAELHRVDVPHTEVVDEQILIDVPQNGWLYGHNGYHPVDVDGNLMSGNLHHHVKSMWFINLRVSCDHLAIGGIFMKFMNQSQIRGERGPTL